MVICKYHDIADVDRYEYNKKEIKKESGRRME